MQRSLSIITLLAACASTDSEPTDSQEAGPCLEIELSELRFGAAPLAGPPIERPVVLHNACSGQLLLEPPTVEQEGDAFEVVEAEMGTLGPDESVTWTLRLSPQAPGRAEGRLKILSNGGRGSVDLRGTGRGPQLTLEPFAVNFGELEVGCASERTVELRNTGNEPLQITELALSSSPDLSLLSAPSRPLALAPQESASAVLRYQAPTPTPLAATLRIASDDPLTPVAELNLSGEGITGPVRTERFEQATSPRPDILVTIDRSGRMPVTLAGLLEDVPALFSGLRERGADAHVAVIVADEGCPAGTPAFIESASDPAAASEDFAALADIGFTRATAGLDEERGFLLANRALEQTGDEACLAGFRRKDASLATVHISDDNEQSSIGWEAYIEGIAQLTGDSGQVSVHGIAGDYPSGCVGAVSGDQYYFASLSSGGSYHPICTDNHAEGFDDLAAALSRPRLSFRLDHEPMPETLTVHVDGVRWTTDWSYDATYRAIRLEPALAPDPSSELQVTYTERLECR